MQGQGWRGTAQRTPAIDRTDGSRAGLQKQLGNRIQELTKKADPPFLFGISQYSGFLGKQDVFQSIALAKNADGVEKAMKAIVPQKNLSPSGKGNKGHAN